MKDLQQAFEQLKARNSERDRRMREVALVRAGQADQVFQGLFPEGVWYIFCLVQGVNHFICKPPTLLLSLFTDF